MIPITIPVDAHDASRIIAIIETTETISVANAPTRAKVFTFLSIHYTFNWEVSRPTPAFLPIAGIETNFANETNPNYQPDT
jgi:hypothetical protein